MADRAPTYTFGLFRDAAIIWRARPCDVLVTEDRDGWAIQLVFENRDALACLRDEVLQEIDEFSTSPLFATIVVEQNATLSCHVETDALIPRRSAESAGSEPTLATADTRHVETPLRVPGQTVPSDDLLQSLLANPDHPARIQFSLIDGASITDRDLVCRRLEVLRRDEMSASDCDRLPLVEQPQRLQRALGVYSDSLLDEEIWGHAPLYLESCDRRSSGQSPEMDCVRQLVEILQSRIAAGCTLLDAGCGAGHYYISLRSLECEYYGIDSFREGIMIGRQNLQKFGLHAERLQVRHVESLSRTEQYDVIVAFNLLAYLPDFRLPLERMTQSCRQLLVIRSSFGDETTVRWIPDLLLEDGYQDLPFYQNVYSRDDVRTFLEQRGFDVEFIADRRQSEVWGGQPEIVAGIEIPYEILVAQRRADWV